jgi:hypothetical protein
MTGIDLHLRADELLAYWSRCGLTADWIANYLASELDPKGRATARSVLSTVINELLENAVKFSVDPQGSIRIAARREGNSVRIETWNRASAGRVHLLESTLEALARSSADVLFSQRIAQGGAPGAPGVGIIIIRRDHGARIQTHVETHADATVHVHMTVHLDLPRTAEP